MNVKEIAKVTFNLVAIYVVGGLLLAWVLAEASARGLFQADVVGLALIIALGAFGCARYQT